MKLTVINATTRAFRVSCDEDVVSKHVATAASTSLIGSSSSRAKSAILLARRPRKDIVPVIADHSRPRISFDLPTGEEASFDRAPSRPARRAQHPQRLRLEMLDVQNADDVAMSLQVRSSFEVLFDRKSATAKWTEIKARELSTDRDASPCQLCGARQSSLSRSGRSNEGSRLWSKHLDRVQNRPTNRISRLDSAQPLSSKERLPLLVPKGRQCDQASEKSRVGHSIAVKADIFLEQCTCQVQTQLKVFARQVRVLGALSWKHRKLIHFSLFPWRPLNGLYPSSSGNRILNSWTAKHTSS